MQKSIIGSSVHKESNNSILDSWLDIEPLVDVEVSSEEHLNPIEFALLLNCNQGWHAATPGPQVIRLLFKTAQDIESIFLEFEEEKIERTQEFVLRYYDIKNQSHEILRQQWNFSPKGANREIEEIKVKLSALKTLELYITPDINNNEVYATLKSLRIA